MVANFPTSINNFKLIAVNEVRIGDKTEEIKRILEHSIVHDYEIISSNIINQKFKEDVIDNSFVDDYTMSMNILSLWYVYKYMSSIKKILLLDDDVILREGFDKVFESDKQMDENHFRRIGRSTLFHNATNSHKRELYDMLIERGIIHDSYF